MTILRLIKAQNPRLKVTHIIVLSFDRSGRYGWDHIQNFIREIKYSIVESIIIVLTANQDIMCYEYNRMGCWVDFFFHSSKILKY